MADAIPTPVTAEPAPEVFLDENGRVVPELPFDLKTICPDANIMFAFGQMNLTPREKAVVSVILREIPDYDKNMVFHRHTDNAEHHRSTPTTCNIFFRDWEGEQTRRLSIEILNHSNNSTGWSPFLDGFQGGFRKVIGLSREIKRPKAAEGSILPIPGPITISTAMAKKRLVLDCEPQVLLDAFRMEDGAMLAYHQSLETQTNSMATYQSQLELRQREHDEKSKICKDLKNDAEWLGEKVSPTLATFISNQQYQQAIAAGKLNQVQKCLTSAERALKKIKNEIAIAMEDIRKLGGTNIDKQLAGLTVLLESGIILNAKFTPEEFIFTTYPIILRTNDMVCPCNDKACNNIKFGTGHQDMDIFMGRIEITIHARQWHNTRGGGIEDCRNIMMRGIDYTEGNWCHLHVQQTNYKRCRHICLATYHDEIRKLMAKGDLSNLVVLMVNFLQTFNPHSPLVYMEEVVLQACRIEGDMVRPAHLKASTVIPQLIKEKQ